MKTIRVLVNRWWTKYRPFVSRKEYEKSVKRADYLGVRVTNLMRENDEERKRIQSLISSDMRMRLDSKDRHLWGLSIEFSDEMILRFGNQDSDTLRYLARQLTAKIESELMTINFSRVRRYADWRPSSGWNYEANRR